MQSARSDGDHLRHSRSAADARNKGPASGFPVRSNAGHTAGIGTSGAATPGRSIRLRIPLEHVWFAPGADFALAQISGGRGLALLTKLATAPVVTRLQVPPAPALVAFSPSGDSAALFYPNPARLLILAGLPDVPRAGWEFQLAAVEEGLAALAVSDGGQAVLAAAATAPAPVWMVTPQAGQQLLYTASRFVSLTFLNRSLDAAIAGGLEGEVVLLRNSEGNAQIVTLDAAAEILKHPVGIAAAADNRTLFVANADPPAIAILPADGTHYSTLKCRYSPTRLERMLAGSVYRISDAGHGTVWLFDAAPANSRILFLPDKPPGELTAPPRTAGGGLR